MSETGDTPSVQATTPADLTYHVGSLTTTVNLHTEGMRTLEAEINRVLDEIRYLKEDRETTTSRLLSLETELAELKTQATETPETSQEIPVPAVVESPAARTEPAETLRRVSLFG